ncbi:xylulokinase [Bacillus timonensis]|uniref:xylulokinase n=1 Tax=Bacillus timonensis TaxID=1033734 RepID=UPI00028825E7|nr:FGGY family carbohydrate kinase [Bacillus timonensis]
MSHVIGIDIGTSGVKVAAMNKEGVWGYLEYHPYSLLFPRDGWVEIDVNEVWEIVKNNLVKVWKRVEAEGSVDAISLSSFCNSSVFMDSDGNALYNGIMYLDQRSKKEAEWINSFIGKERIFEITGNRLELGMYTVTTHLWFKNNEPNLYEKTFKWGSLSTFILHKLTGEFVMDWTQASFSGLFEINNYEWSNEICERVGISKDKLPTVCDPSLIIGNLINTDIEGKRVPVVAGAADTACSALALDVQPNTIFESVGTSNVLTVCTDNTLVLDNKFLNRCHVIKGRWLSHGAMSFPGAAIQWFYERFLKPEGYQIEILNEFANKSPIGSNGVYFLPYMQGERSPIWDPNARGSFVGINLNTSKEDMYRSILEGCSFGLKQIYEIIETKYKISPMSIQSIGGGSKNRAWSQIKANVLNKTFEHKNISETAVLGACLIAGNAIGYFSSYEEATSVMTNETIGWVKPEEERVDAYLQLYQVHNRLYPALKTFFSQCVELNEEKMEVKC